MKGLLLGVLGAFATASLGCGSESRETEAPESGAGVPIAGMYEVTGETVSLASGDTRPISGKVILAVEGDSFTSTFSLTTTVPGADEAMPADVIGKGEGTIEGRTLRGNAETQLVMATVPGVDPAFAYVPRLVSTRIVSEAIATVASDGTVQIEIRNDPAAGEEYAPTRTTLRGSRIGGPDVASGPPSH